MAIQGELVVKEKVAYNREAELIGVLRDVLNNPAFYTIFGCCVVELLQRVVIEKTPAEGPHWHWELPNFGFQPAKPSENIALISPLLGGAIEVGLIVNLMGPSVKEMLSSAGGLAGIAGLLKGT